MPVFLIPLVAGGYYYYQNMKAKVRGEPLEEQQEGAPTSLQHMQGNAPDLGSSSIEVSLVSPAQSQQEQETGETIREVITEDAKEVITEEQDGAVKSQILLRKGSSESAQSDGTCEEAAPPKEEQDEETTGGILGAACGGCDEDALFEIVDCGGNGGNSLEKRIAVVFSSR